MDLPLYMNGEAIGTVTVAAEGPGLSFHAQCPFMDGIHRAYAIAGDRQVLIGVLEPSNSGMRTKKYCSAISLQGINAADFTHGEIHETLFSPLTGRRDKAATVWKKCHDPCRLFADPVAASSLDMNFEYYTMENGNSLVLGTIWQDGIFPMPGLFCLCSVGTINGQRAVLIEITKERYSDRL